MFLGFALALTPLAIITVWSIAAEGAKETLTELAGGLLLIGLILLGFLAYH